MKVNTFRVALFDLAYLWPVSQQIHVTTLTSKSYKLLMKDFYDTWKMQIIALIQL